MNCPRCGTILMAGAQFCSACGAPANVAPPPNYQPGAFAAGNVVSPPPAYPAIATPPGYPGPGIPYGHAAPPNVGQGIHLDQDAQGQGRGYTYEIMYQPSFSLVVLKLQPEQSILAEAGAMVSMSANVELQSEMKGGFLGALKRAAGGESAFISTFTARSGPGEVCLAPGSPGDIAAVELNNQTFYVQSSS